MSADRIAAQACVVPFIVLIDKDREFLCRRFQHAPGRNVVALRPAALVQFRPQPTFQEGPVKADAVAAGHKDTVGNAGERAGRNLVSVIHKPHGHGNVKLFRTGAKEGCVRVEVFQRNMVLVAVCTQRLPVQKILGAGILDCADPDTEIVERIGHTDFAEFTILRLGFPIDRAGKISRVALISIDIRVIEAEILRVERTVTDDGFFLHFAPVNSIGRLISDKTGRDMTGNRFIPCFRRAGRVCIQKRGEIVGHDAAEQDIVFCAALKFNQTKLRLFPVDPVIAECQAGILRRTQIALFLGSLLRAGTVIQAILLSIKKHAVIGTAAWSLPGLVKRNGNFLFDRCMQLQLRAVHLVDQIVIDKQLGAAADINTVGVCRTFGLDRLLFAHGVPPYLGVQKRKE